MPTALDLSLEVWEMIVNQPVLDMPSVRRLSTVSSACRAIAHQRRLTVTPGCGIFTEGDEGDEGDEAAAVRQSEALGMMHEDGAWPLVRVEPEVLFRVARALSECDPPRFVEAVRWFREAAEQGHVRAQCSLGYCYDLGKGVEEDKAEAVRWYREAAEQGDVRAQNNLGYAYANGDGVEEDKVEAVRWCREAAEQGDPDAQYNLAFSYDKGEGVEEDKAEALRWYRQAAEQGDPDAQYNLALCFTNGEGVEEDKVEAARWFEKAAEQGHAKAQCALGLAYDKGEGVEEDKAEAVRWYRRAAEQGDPDAQYNLALCFTNGKGIEEDKAEAVRWYRRAAEQGDPDAQYNLALCFTNGKGIEEDKAEAVRWYRRAAEQGDPDAQCCLGRLLFVGRGGVDKDEAAAGEWLHKAAGQGHGPGSNWLGLWLLATGDGNPAEARQLFRAAVNADAPDDEDEFVGFEARARRNLGLALEGGVGGDVDLAGALALYREAAAGEHPDAVACYSLWLLASQGAEGKTTADTEPFQRLQGLGAEERAALAKAAIDEHELLSGSELASLWASRALGAAQELGHEG